MSASVAQPVLVLGTHNIKKRAELAELLQPLGLRLLTLADFSEAMQVVEDGESFAANARLKAVEQARHLGHWVLGEDSGLCVDALGGRPGIYSARYAGPDADDEANNQLLLEEMDGIRPERRTAHYVCHMTLSDSQGEIRAESHGVCRGRIRTALSGSGGFGYDPLFELPEYHRTFGQLGNTVKSVLSHRARAMRQLVPQADRLLSSGSWR